MILAGLGLHWHYKRTSDSITLTDAGAAGLTRPLSTSKFFVIIFGYLLISAAIYYGLNVGLL
jgi:hypothetical protein